MEKIIVVGGGGHARSVINVLHKVGTYHVLGYVDIKDHGPILGVEYLGSDDDLGALKEQYSCTKAVIGLGTVDLSDKRALLIKSVEAKGFDCPTIISPTAIINEDVEIQKGTVVFDGVIVNVGAKVGAYCILNIGCVVEHNCIIGDFVHVAPGVTLSGGVSVGDHSLIAVGSSVMQYKVITSDCLIGAGAVVVNDCKEPGVYVGVPAKRQ